MMGDLSQSPPKFYQGFGLGTVLPHENSYGSLTKDSHRSIQEETAHRRQSSNVSQKEQARRMIKKIPSKIKVIEGNLQARFNSVQPSRESPQQPVFPITIRNAYDNSAYNFTNIKQPLTTNNESFYYDGQEVMPKKQVLISLDPPKIDFSHFMHNSAETARLRRDLKQEERLRH